MVFLQQDKAYAYKSINANNVKDITYNKKGKSNYPNTRCDCAFGHGIQPNLFLFIWYTLFPITQILKD